VDQSVPWVQVLVQMVHGPDVPVRGIISSADGGLRSRDEVGWTAFSGALPPTFTGGGIEATELRVWRDGMRVRIEHLDGRPLLLCDAVTCWRFRKGRELPRVAPAATLRFVGNGTGLLARRPAEDWVGDDYTRPTGPLTTTTYLSRPAWQFELAPPPQSRSPRTAHPMRMVVDQQTGLVLEQRIDAVGSAERWSQFFIGEVFDEALFTWDGPAESVAAEARRQRAADRALRAERRRWFDTHVTAEPLNAAVTADLDLQYLHTFDSGTGAFEARLGRRGITASLARRPRSTEVWELQWAGPVHRWSTSRFDWALAVHDVELTAEGLAELQARLHPGEQTVPTGEP